MKRPFHAVANLNGATLVDLKDPGVNGTVYLTRATLSITTHVNAKTVSIQDNAGSPVVVAVANDLTVAAGVPDVKTWDFGKYGVPLTKGKKLQTVGQAAGSAGIVYAEGFVLS
jgi:N-acetylglucosamine-6-phosphate deacetylase